MLVQIIDREGHVVEEVRATLVRHITPSEVGFVDVQGRNRSFSFLRTEQLSITHEEQPA